MEEMKVRTRVTADAEEQEQEIRSDREAEANSGGGEKKGKLLGFHEVTILLILERASTQPASSKLRGCSQLKKYVNFGFFFLFFFSFYSSA